MLTCNVPLFQFNSKRPKRKATSASIKPVRKKQKSELDSDDEDIESGKLKGTGQASLAMHVTKLYLALSVLNCFPLRFCVDRSYNSTYLVKTQQCSVELN